MKVLYRIRPVDKKSVEAFYDVYKTMPDGTVRGWQVTELYRWGQGFVETVDELPYKEDSFVCVETQLGWGCELEDHCSTYFEFDDSFTEEEQAEIEELWYNGDPTDSDGRSGAAWLYDVSDWEVEDDIVRILGPFKVDKIDEDVYNSVIEEVVELKSRPVKKKTSEAWPF